MELLLLKCSYRIQQKWDNAAVRMNGVPTKKVFRRDVEMDGAAKMWRTHQKGVMQPSKGMRRRQNGVQQRWGSGRNE
jgi:hypothetical protein